jgi:hypothetical protein
LACSSFRTNVPESPRWLFIDGKEDQAEELVRLIEREVQRRTGQELPPAEEKIKVRRRRPIPLGMIVHSVLTP